MVSLRKIEKDLEKEIKRQQEKLARKRKFTGEAQSISSKIAEAEARGEGFSLEPVCIYMARLENLPRELLLARFAEVFGDTPDRPTQRRWLVDKLTRKFQREHYQSNNVPIPEALRMRDFLFSLTTPPPPTERDSTEDRERKTNFDLDPEMKIVATVENPFARGKSWTAFQIVMLAGDKGLSFAAMALRLKRVVGFHEDKAQRYARKMFTRWVEKGWLEIKLRSKK